ncbi:hypothetical protein PLESTB_000054300 [Pleodorina starrii]|uniref:Uncharacterized protein n=1 Tax=Pleodorina starrii TaxID=330485 RepID=A0A9W6EWF1_9CHLO|nr:hypothetical protein PLESTB_000054300 [Pleodorina starrii]
MHSAALSSCLARPVAISHLRWEPILPRLSFRDTPQPPSPPPSRAPLPPLPPGIATVTTDFSAGFTGVSLTTATGTVEKTALSAFVDTFKQQINAVWGIPLDQIDVSSVTVNGMPYTIARRRRAALETSATTDSTFVRRALSVEGREMAGLRALGLVSLVELLPVGEGGEQRPAVATAYSNPSISSTTIAAAEAKTWKVAATARSPYPAAAQALAAASAASLASAPPHCGQHPPRVMCPPRPPRSWVRPRRRSFRSPPATAPLPPWPGRLQTERLPRGFWTCPSCPPTPPPALPGPWVSTSSTWGPCSRW